MKRSTIDLLWFAGFVGLGFAVGYGVGQKTREATPSHVDANYEAGKLTITADVSGAVKQGVSGFLGDLVNG